MSSFNYFYIFVYLIFIFSYCIYTIFSKSKYLFPNYILNLHTYKISIKSLLLFKYPINSATLICHTLIRSFYTLYDCQTIYTVVQRSFSLKIFNKLYLNCEFYHTYLTTKIHPKS